MFCGYCRFDMTILLKAKSFLYDKEDDCHLEIIQRGNNPLSLISKRESSLSKRRSSLFRRENHPSRNEDHNHIEQTVNHHLEEKSIPSFRNDRGRIISKRDLSFRKERRHHFKTTVLPEIILQLIYNKSE